MTGTAVKSKSWKRITTDRLLQLFKQQVVKGYLAPPTSLTPHFQQNRYTGGIITN